MVAQLTDPTTQSSSGIDEDEDSTEDPTIHALATLRENGDLRKFQDDLAYLLDEVEQVQNGEVDDLEEALTAWCQQTEATAAKMRDPDFVRLLKLSGNCPKLLETLLPPTAQAPEEVLDRYLSILALVVDSEASTVEAWLLAEKRPSQRTADLVAQMLLQELDQMAVTYNLAADRAALGARALRHLQLCDRLLPVLAKIAPSFASSYLVKLQAGAYTLVSLDLESPDGAGTRHSITTALMALYIRLVEMMWSQGQMKDHSIWSFFDDLVIRLQQRTQERAVEGPSILDPIYRSLLRLSGTASELSQLQGSDLLPKQSLLDGTTAWIERQMDHIGEHAQSIETCVAVMSNLVECLAQDGPVELPLHLYHVLGRLWMAVKIGPLADCDDESWRSLKMTLAILVANVELVSAQSRQRLEDRQVTLDGVAQVLETCLETRAKDGVEATACGPRLLLSRLLEV